MQSLYRSGHIQVIQVTPSSTPTEINNAVKAAFGGLRAVLDGIFSMDGWRLLTRVSRGKGRFPYLHPNKKGGDMTRKDLEWYTLTHSVSLSLI
jgi:hypothetical protein